MPFIPQIGSGIICDGYYHIVDEMTWDVEEVLLNVYCEQSFYEQETLDKFINDLTNVGWECFEDIDTVKENLPESEYTNNNVIKLNNLKN